MVVDGAVYKRTLAPPRKHEKAPDQKWSGAFLSRKQFQLVLYLSTFYHRLTNFSIQCARRGKLRSNARQAWVAWLFEIALQLVYEMPQCGSFSLLGEQRGTCLALKV